MCACARCVYYLAESCGGFHVVECLAGWLSAGVQISAMNSVRMYVRFI